MFVHHITEIIELNTHEKKTTPYTYVLLIVYFTACVCLEALVFLHGVYFV